MTGISPGCPFYAHALHYLPATVTKVTPWVLIPNWRSNQCALITSAHSPCIMNEPLWPECPRNPENNESQCLISTS